MAMKELGTFFANIWHLSENRIVFTCINSAWRVERVEGIGTRTSPNNVISYQE